MRRLQQIVDGVVTVAIGIGAGYGLAALFVRLWAPPPTPENSSPPPEAFLFLWGAVLGFAAIVLARVLFIPWLSRRRRPGA